MYTSVPIIWFVTRGLIFIALQMLLLSSLVTFVSSLFFFQLCKKAMKKYAIIGMLIGIISASYVLILSDPQTLIFVTSNYTTFFLPINALIAYICFGFLRTAQTRPNEFLYYYGDKKDRRKN